MAALRYWRHYGIRWMLWLVWRRVFTFLQRLPLTPLCQYHWLSGDKSEQHCVLILGHQDDLHETADGWRTGTYPGALKA